MASEEHKQLASMIKGTHASLREEFRTHGAKVAWQRHLSRTDTLQKYAKSMHKLATAYWTNSQVDESNGKCNDRVKWIKRQCKNYFFHCGKEMYDAREKEIRLKMDSDEFVDNLNGFDIDTEEACPIEKILLLDVGSCYDPFGKDDIFDTTAIDLFPVLEKVIKCDFVQVSIGKEKIMSQDGQEIIQLQENAFDAVVFSLFLEYLPCPSLRYDCCRKAYNLLKHRGILCIVTPDSKHVGANAKLIKSWRYALSKMGFMRIKYEKLKHIHCMVFRKCVLQEVAVRWSRMQEIPNDDTLYECGTKIFIPQDFQPLSAKNTVVQDNKYDVANILNTFSELPFYTF